MISNGYTSITLKDILNKVDEGQILNFYFGITQVPFRMTILCMFFVAINIYSKSINRIKFEN